MSSEIILAVITGICSVAGVVITSSANSRKLQHQIEINQAVVNTKIENLTDEVRTHNNFARRMPVVEEQIKVANHRIEDLERKIDHE